MSALVMRCVIGLSILGDLVVDNNDDTAVNMSLSRVAARYLLVNAS